MSNLQGYYWWTFMKHFIKLAIEPDLVMIHKIEKKELVQNRFLRIQDDTKKSLIINYYRKWINRR